MREELQIQFEVFTSEEKLPEMFKNVWEAAKRAKENSYAPYSHFNVGCAIELETGEIIEGVNQENAAFPAGLCAERTAMYRAGATLPKVPFKALAIFAAKEGSNNPEEASPCGGCRQVMLEFRKRHQQDFNVLFPGKEGSIIVMKSPEDLFPFTFDL